MAEQFAYNANQKFELPCSNRVAVGLIILLAAIATLIIQQVWWQIFMLIELVIVVACGELLTRNLPRRLRHQIKLNSHRADGSKSKKRAQIEKDSLRSFKQSATICFAFMLVPVNAVIFAYCFFVPYLDGYRDSHVFKQNEDWLRMLLNPTFQVCALTFLLVILCYDAMKNIYFRLIKDLDDEISFRAENYSVHDLIHPHRGPRSKKQKTKQQVS